MTRREHIRKIGFTGVFMALVVIFAYIPMPMPNGLEITLAIIPVAVGAILSGPKVGLILGATFGFASFTQCFGISPFGTALLDINPILTLLVCVPTRMLAGFIPGIFHKYLQKVMNKSISALIACILTALLNTVFFMSALVICFYNTEYIQGFVETLGAVNPLSFILLFVGINGLVEIICAVIVSFPVVKTLENIEI